MSNDTDDAEGISEEALASIADIARSRRREWARRGWLRIATERRGYGELDAVELVVLAELARGLDLTDAALVWEEVRATLASARPGDSLLVVADLRHRHGTLAFEIAEVGELVVGGDPFRVFDLTPAVERARETYRRLAGGGPKR